MTRNGSLGDSTELLRAALPCCERRVWLTVLDAAVADGRLALAIGTGELGAYNACVQVEAEVTGLPEGSFTCTHPYVAAGLDPAQAEVVQAKSHVSYRAGLAALTPRSVVADTPGPTPDDLTRLPFTRRPRPLFPFEEI